MLPLCDSFSSESKRSFLHFPPGSAAEAPLACSSRPQYLPASTEFSVISCGGLSCPRGADWPLSSPISSLLTSPGETGAMSSAVWGCFCLTDDAQKVAPMGDAMSREEGASAKVEKGEECFDLTNSMM